MDKVPLNNATLSLIFSKIKYRKSIDSLDDSKSKINNLIRKYNLPDIVIIYLWNSKKYVKNIIKNQEDLPTSIRRDLINQCMNVFSSNNPWISVLRNFLQLHNPSDEELKELLNPEAKSHDDLVLECWENKPDDCHRLGYDNSLYNTIIRSSIKAEPHKHIVNIISYVLLNIPDMQKHILDEILSLNNSFIIQNILQPVFKITAVNDFTVNYLLTHMNKNIFGEIIKYAMHRENLSDNMMAKIYLWN